MKQFKLQNVSMFTLLKVLEEIKPAECESSQDVLTLSDIIQTLLQTTKEYKDKFDKFDEKRKELVEAATLKFNKEVAKIKKDNERALLEKKYNDQLEKDIVEKCSKEHGLVVLLSKKIVCAELTDREYERLARFAESDGVRTKYTSLESYTQVLRALAK